MKRAPGDAVLHAELARILAQAGRPDQALFFAKYAATSKSIAAVESAAIAFTMLNDAEASLDALRRAILMDPSQAYSHNALGKRLIELRHLDDARESIERAFALSPSDPAIAANIALIYSETWSLEDGLSTLRVARDRTPNLAMLQHQLPYLSNYSDRVTPAEVFAEHRRFADLISRDSKALADPPLHQPGPADTERTLKVGLMSADFREHSVSRFLEPILVHHDPAVVRYTLFPVIPVEDETTRRFKSMTEGWSRSAMLPEREAAAAIRREGIDILVDLSGLTRGMRAGIFMSRAAPVQINYLGYPNTTALPNMDVRIVDSITDPPGADAYATERLFRLDPSFLCFAQPPIARDIPSRGSTLNGPVTFASFNYLTKITPTTLDLWTTILKQVPDSRLVLKSASLSHAAVRSRISVALTSRGIDASRFDLSPYLDDLAAHYRLYHHVDIALDPFPYNGTTTTCEALYMGVPVITLEGDHHAARVGASLLTNAGVPELIARTPAEYIRKAVELAGSPRRRSQYHAELRTKLAASPLGDGLAFARRFQDALRQMWQASCTKRLDHPPDTHGQPTANVFKKH